MDCTSKEDISKLREAIFAKAEENCRLCIEEAQAEIKKQTAEKEKKLQLEIAKITEEAAKKAEQATKQIIQQAKQKNAAEILCFKSSLLEGAFGRLTEKLISFRENEDYLLILCGMADEAAELLKTDKIILSLAKEDVALKDKLLAELKKILPEVSFNVCETPALITGGILAVAGDGRKQIYIDWKNIVEDYSEDFADEIFGSDHNDGGK